MSQPGTPVVFISFDSLHWVKDADQILILDERHQEIRSLRGEEAAVWSWLVMKYPYQKVIRLLAALLAQPSEEAEKRLKVILETWCLAGWLEIEAG